MTSYILVICITETLHITLHVTALNIHDMNIYHDMTSHTLLTCKLHANHNEEAGKHAGYNNELYMMWYYVAS